jgi:hypothetical protein
MKYFKLFEQFVTENNQPVNEAKISYSLKDLMRDMKRNKNYAEMLDLVASKLRINPKDIAVITNKDKDFKDYQDEFKNDPFASLNNPSDETKLYYNRKINVLMGSTGGTEITYFVPSDKLLENKINEASKVYTLEDMIDDNKSERDIQKAMAMCAVSLGLDPKKIAVVTTDDDDYSEYQAKYKNSRFTPFNNPSAEMSTSYAKGENIISFNDGSISGFFIPIEFMNESKLSSKEKKIIDKFTKWADGEDPTSIDIDYYSAQKKLNSEEKALLKRTFLEDFSITSTGPLSSDIRPRIGS